MQPPRGPRLPPGFWWRLWRSGMIVSIASVFIAVGSIAFALAFPRLVVLLAVGLVGGAVLLFIYFRDRISGRR